jgi:hypothetical protein
VCVAGIAEVFGTHHDYDIHRLGQLAVTPHVGPLLYTSSPINATESECDTVLENYHGVSLFPKPVRLNWLRRV